MTEIQSNEKKKKIKSTKRNDLEGLASIDLELDHKTYALLLKLVKKSGYEIDSDVNKRQRRKTMDGIRGVITQGIVELYQKYATEDVADDNDEKQDLGLKKIDQQAYIFSNRALAMKKNKIPIKDIVSTLQSKLPAFLKNSKTGKLLNEETMNEFVKASKIPSIKSPELTKSMKKDLEKVKILKYFA
jgi:hypothetical protein